MQLRLVVAVIASQLSPEGQHLGDDKHCWYITRYTCMIRASQVQRHAQVSQQWHMPWSSFHPHERQKPGHGNAEQPIHCSAAA